LLFLAPLTGPGCELQLDNAGAVFGFVSATGTASVPMTIPNDPANAGLHIYNQYLMLGSAGAATQLLDSNTQQ